MPKRGYSGPLKSELVCRKCGANWTYTEKAVKAICPYCGAAKDARDRSAEYAQYPNAEARKQAMAVWSKDVANRRARGAARRALLRKRVLFRISGSITPACVRCGCNDVRLLEINHKNGGGNQENQKGKFASKFMHDIATGKRPVDDLEILCKPCNAIHALELRFGPIPMRVVWEGPSQA